MRAGARWVLLGLSLLGGISCGGGDGPAGGLLDITLTTPNNNDGAMLLVISGGEINSVEGTGYQTYSAVAGSTTARVVIIGDITNGLVARIVVPDLSLASNYTAYVEQAAARDTYFLQSSGGYAVTVGN